MKREEEQLQIAFFEWAKWQEGRYPELGRMHHIPNGGKRTKAEAAIFKAMGVKSGIPDVFLPAPRGIYHGLYIEFKSDSGKTSKNQDELLVIDKYGQELADKCMLGEGKAYEV